MKNFITFLVVEIVYGFLPFAVLHFSIPFLKELDNETVKGIVSYPIFGWIFLILVEKSIIFYIDWKRKDEFEYLQFDD